MPSVRRLIALLLVTLWLPAMLHCPLEAAGISLGETCCTDPHADAVGDDHCATDNCGVLESNLVRPVSDDLVVPAPVELACLCLVSETQPETVTVPTVSPERTHCPPELARTWQFVVRAALSPRAP